MSELKTQWKVWTDEGAGVTDESLKVWKSCKGKLGRIWHIIIKQHTPPEFNMEIYADHGFVLLSGCNCGYGGTGPHGTLEIFNDLGILGMQDVIFSNSEVRWPLPSDNSLAKW